MDHEVAKGEEHAEGFLDSEEALEGPFSVELDGGERRGGREPLRGDDVLAGVVAFGGAGPEEEAVVEGCGGRGGLAGGAGERGWGVRYARMGV